MTLRAVFDCMIYLQAAANTRGPAGACFIAAERGACDLFVSDAGLGELRDVLDRPKTRKRFPQLTDDAVASFLCRMAAMVTVVGPAPAVVTLSRDPKDAKYLDLAVAAGAGFVVSRDNDLLDLMTGSDPDAVAFRTAHSTI